MSGSIKHDHTLNPVTALEFYEGPDSDPALTGPFLLAGEGSFLKVFDAETTKLISQYEIFDGQTIHGTVARGAVPKSKDDLQVVIWGGHSVRFLTRKDFEWLLRGSVKSLTFATTSVSDWILDATFSFSEGNICVLVTAHNAVIRVALDWNSGEISLNELPSPSRSILYSAHIIWDTPRQILVAAGTVFGEIIVWDIAVTENTRDVGLGESKVLSTFTGHEGSIFGVNISPLITGPGDFSRRFLASCSDDRTIRVWDLSEVVSSDKESHNLDQTQQTGFGELATSVTSREKCVATVMGHASRIWRVRFLIRDFGFRSDPPIINILSFGEDATAQQWALELDISESPIPHLNSSLSASRLRPKGILDHLKSFVFHSGKHIWSTALRPASSRCTLATGGADGKLSLYDVAPSLQKTSNCSSVKENTSSSNEWTLDEVFATFPSNHLTKTEKEEAQRELTIPMTPQEASSPKKKPKKLPKDTFNRYAFISNNDFLATTTFGRVLIGHIGSSIKWSEILLPELGNEDLKSYSVVESCQEAGLVFLGSAKGSIYCYAKGSSELRLVGSVHGKVADMFRVNAFHGSGKDTYALLVTTLSSDIVTLFPIGKNSQQDPQLEDPVHYKLPGRFIATSAGTTHGDGVLGTLILGSRNGSIATYKHRHSSTYTSNEHLDSICVWDPEESKAGDAITSVTPLPNPLYEGKLYFLTTGRNGLCSIFTIYYDNGKHVVTPVHHGTPPFGPNVEAAWFSGPENHLVLSGFHSKNFIIWNETLQQEISNVECGGAHRSYAYSSAGHFIYTKASKLYIHTQYKPSHKIIKAGGHGREIKACAVSPDKRFFATGAEDTIIRIWTYAKTGVECLAVTQKHTAGIQHLQWHGSSYLFSSGGNEEFFIWAITAIPAFQTTPQSSHARIGIVCEASCPDQSAEKDLRIMSFDVSEIPNNVLLISLAYSDSTIKHYTYTKPSGFNLRAQGRYTSSCLTQIKHLDISYERITFLTAATDGCLAFWICDLTSSMPELLLESNRKIHQNAIKALDSHALLLSSMPAWIVATGGDDNALIITVFISPSNVQVFRLAKAHAAAITGLTFVPLEERRFRVVSSGNDQRVKEWDIRVRVREFDKEADKNTEIQLEIIGEVFTSVADVGDVAYLGNKKVLVVGNGMQVFDTQLK